MEGKRPDAAFTPCEGRTQVPFDVQLPRDLIAWKNWARFLIDQGISPQFVRWSEWRKDATGLFDTSKPPDSAPPAPALSVTKRFPALAATIAWHRGPQKWDLLYRLLFRIHSGERHLLDMPSDDDVAAAEDMAKAVRRDAHKMHAFVRFRMVEDEHAIDGQRYVAFHRSSHPIICREASWFAKRFPRMTWAILTPDGSAAWDGEILIYGPAATADDRPDDDGVEDLWLTYYRSIFNPSRVNRRAMIKEMPKKYWATLPEAKLIPELLEQAQDQGQEYHPAVQRGQVSVANVPRDLTLPQLAESARTCRSCRLCGMGTQTVFGVGPPDANLMLVGEQPGDQEDLSGQPFVGPAGQLLDEVMREVGIRRTEVYLTNAVKHFSHEVKDELRVHRKPRVAEQHACKPWLDAEIAAVRPKVLVCLGATASQNIIGRTSRMTQYLGSVIATPGCPQTIVTYHPAAILRAPAARPQEAVKQRQQLIGDLRRARILIDNCTDFSL